MQCIIKCTKILISAVATPRTSPVGAYNASPDSLVGSPLRLSFPFTPTASRSRHRFGPPNNIDVAPPMLLCAALNDYVVNYQSYNWCASIQLDRRHRRQQPGIYDRFWHDELPYVCQYHCK